MTPIILPRPSNYFAATGYSASDQLQIMGMSSVLNEREQGSFPFGWREHPRYNTVDAALCETPPEMPPVVLDTLSHTVRTLLVN
jgi:hypothetical protein